MTAKSPTKWFTVKERLALLKRDELFELLRGLYLLSPQNKQFLKESLSERNQPLRDFSQSMDGVIDPFYEDDEITEVHLMKSVNAINDYRDTHSDDTEGIVELMLTLLEEAILSLQDGEEVADECFPILENVSNELAGVLKTVQGKTVYEEFGRERLTALADKIPEEHGDFGKSFRDRIADLEASTEK